MAQEQALIIEDEEDLAILFAEALQHANYQTTIARDGQQARDLLLMIQPGLVVLDLHLPQESGAEVLRFIRANSTIARTPVIVASADERSIKLVEEIADVTLVKPVAFTQMRDIASRFHSRNQQAA